MSEALFRGDCFSRDRHNSKADAEGGVVLKVAVSPGGTLVDGITVIATTAGGMLVAGQCSLRVSHRIAGIGTKLALAPLPDVSEHVIKTEVIRFLLPHGTGRAAAVALIPGNVIQGPIGFACAAGPGRVFLFRFCR